VNSRVMFCLLASVAMLGQPAAAQLPADAPIAVKKCDDPKIPIGRLPKAIGTVTFRLTKDGHPDTASLAVVKVLGLSVAGFKSAAARQLSACRLDADKIGATSLVSASITIDSFAVSVAAAEWISDPATPLAVEHFDLPHDTMPFALGDARLEERPRPLSCTVQMKGPTVIHASGASRAEAVADAQNQARIANEQYNATNAGLLVAVVRVAVDGKPGSQLRVVELTNPAAGQNLGDRIGSCRYVPGRVLGVVVPAFLQVTMGPTGAH
jgi:hypothetical protein